jgi:hypothetical protein
VCGKPDGKCSSPDDGYTVFCYGERYDRGAYRCLGLSKDSLAYVFVLDRQAILAGLSDDALTDLYERMGSPAFRPKGHTKGSGWLQGHAIGREDKIPSAGIFLGTGANRGLYKDFAGEKLSLFDAVLKFGLVSGGFPDAARYLAGLAGLLKPGASRKRRPPKPKPKLKRLVPVPTPEESQRTQKAAFALKKSLDVSPEDMQFLADRLVGLPLDVVEAYGVGYAVNYRGPHACLAEVDDRRRTVGYQRRYEGGKKRNVGIRGLTKPPKWFGSICLIVEGATDAIACFGMGIDAVGTPGAKPGHAAKAYLQRFFERARNVEFLVLIENDKKPDGSWPGRDGRYEFLRWLLKCHLKGFGSKRSVAVRVTLMPAGYKDVREWFLDQSGQNDPEKRLALGKRLLADLYDRSVAFEHHATKEDAFKYTCAADLLKALEFKAAFSAEVNEARDAARTCVTEPILDENIRESESSQVQEPQAPSEIMRNVKKCPGTSDPRARPRVHALHGHCLSLSEVPGQTPESLIFVTNDPCEHKHARFGGEIIGTENGKPIAKEDDDLLSHTCKSWDENYCFGCSQRQKAESFKRGQLGFKKLETEAWYALPIYTDEWGRTKKSINRAEAHYIKIEQPTGFLVFTEAPLPEAERLDDPQRALYHAVAAIEATNEHKDKHMVQFSWNWPKLPKKRKHVDRGPSHNSPAKAVEAAKKLGVETTVHPTRENASARSTLDATFGYGKTTPEQREDYRHEIGGRTERWQPGKKRKKAKPPGWTWERTEKGFRRKRKPPEQGELFD